MKYYTYILKSIEHDQFYVGQTDNLEERLEKYNIGNRKATKSYKSQE